MTNGTFTYEHILSSKHKTVMNCGNEKAIVANILDVENENGRKMSYHFVDALMLTLLDLLAFLALAGILDIGGFLDIVEVLDLAGLLGHARLLGLIGLLSLARLLGLAALLGLA